MSIVMDAVATATAGVARFQPLGGVTDKTYPYGVYSATLGRGDVPSLDGNEGIRWGQVVVQTFSRTASEALNLAEAVRADLVGIRLNITGYDATPCEQQLDPTVVRDPDDNGVVGVTQTFTFTATPA